MRISSVLFGTAMLLLFFRTPLVDVGGIIFLASMMVTVATAALLLYGRVAQPGRTG